MNYKDIIKGSNVTEEQKKQAIENIDALLEQVKIEYPEMVKQFLKKQYEAINGKHLNEWIARKLVSEMWHTAADGKKVTSEIITPEEASQLIADKSADNQLQCKWDAYVAANTFAHDLGATGLSKSDIMKSTKAFWFNDEDMPDKGKVYDYFSGVIFA